MNRAIIAAALSFAAPAFAQCSYSSTDVAAKSDCSAMKSACGGDTTVTLTSVSAPSIVDIAANDERFSTLVAAVKAAGLVETLDGEGPFTVFAPLNSAFEKLPRGTVDSLLKPENKGALTSVLTYHVVPGAVMAADTNGLTTATTVNGQRFTFERRDGELFVNNAKVVLTDIKAGNGVIHVIDGVILPEQQNIAEVASEAGSFGTLLAAAEAAGLVGALTGGEPYTVLAPTDEAFAALGQATINNLLRPENKDQLKNILLYHVIPGRVFADQAITAGSAAAAQEGTLRFSIQGGAVRVNDARIVNTDIGASNGVIHVIDRVLLP